MEAKTETTRVFMIRGGTFDAEVLIDGQAVWTGRGYFNREEAQTAADRAMKKIATATGFRPPT